MTPNPQPQPLANATLRGVTQQSVQLAQQNLEAFTNITWQDVFGNKISSPPSDWVVIPNGVVPESPAADIGKSIPTDTAITITIASNQSPR